MRLYSKDKLTYHGTNTLMFLKIVAIHLFLAMPMAAIIFVASIIYLANGEHALNVHPVITLTPLPLILAATIFIIFWITRQRRKIEAILQDVHENGFQTTAKFSRRFRAGGGGAPNIYGATTGDGRGPFYFTYTDEAGRTRTILSRERFLSLTIDEFKTEEIFQVKCRGKWVVILTQVSPLSFGPRQNWLPLSQS